MNTVDQKIEHLKYLYEKRITHNQEIVGQLKNKQTKHRIHKLKRRCDRISNLYLYMGMVCTAILSYPIWLFIFIFGPLSEDLKQAFTLLGSISLTALWVVGKSISYKCLDKSEKYKDLVLQIQLEESKTKRLQNHLMKSNQELERLRQLLMDFEKERDSLKEGIVQLEKEQTCQNSISSETNLDCLQQIHENSKREKQKVLK